MYWQKKSLISKIKHSFTSEKVERNHYLIFLFEKEKIRAPFPAIRSNLCQRQRISAAIRGARVSK
ncbi:hypothetical protein LEP1GSC202_0006 [Leptospira yanagawae serovar Saopaulo str. Sao Paulo = ATCC 700523]|uniref:Uncharacterized protein n=1 Tax=Leptospira yanagawae serovar Saopaulo str. Sao Paulo = ATCC 700523 TaxID=1249483 RepID=A0A5E8H7W1_9LEPT|nr:hypothetical protein LEP1GSC202_0006 [Leptospira yanagawae serovar Saopaulo str. Sao Paulo = ATCC 700523]